MDEITSHALPKGQLILPTTIAMILQSAKTHSSLHWLAMNHTSTQADERDIEASTELLPVSTTDEVLAKGSALATGPGWAGSDFVLRQRGGRDRCEHHDHQEPRARCRDIE